jgi:uncharacterized membrane protein HdeD (DUF308 family)
MIIKYTSVDGSALGARWWMLVVRGLAAVMFGMLALARPGISVLALVWIWGAYALVDGAAAVALAARAGSEGRRWGWLLLDGLVSIGAAIVTAMWPGLTALALLMVIAVRAVLTGIAEIVAAVELRKVIRREWMLALSGVLSIGFGAVTLILPGASAIALVTVLGAYAVVFGVLVTALGFRVHHWATREMRTLTGSTPVQA